MNGPDPSRTLHSFATVLLALAVVAVVSVPGLTADDAEATHKPADKVAVAGSVLEVISKEVTDGTHSETVELLSGTLKTSGGTDLLIQVSAECALWTDVTTVGNDESRAIASVKVWVEIDGEPVRVSGQEDPTDDDVGKVVFCNRDYKVKTLQFDDEDATTERYLHTRSANAFAWTALNLAPDLHEIVVKAQIDAEAQPTAAAKAAIGKRSLVVEPVKLANDVSL